MGCGSPWCAKSAEVGENTGDRSKERLHVVRSRRKGRMQEPHFEGSKAKRARRAGIELLRLFSSRGGNAMNLTRAAVSLVLSELDLGATFCEVALCTQDEKTKERNIRNALKAYETALHLLQRLSLGSGEQARFDEKALHLKSLFEQLGLNP
jgi:hypothetical protein